MADTILLYLKIYNNFAHLEIENKDSNRISLDFREARNICGEVLLNFLVKLHPMIILDHALYDFTYLRSCNFSLKDRAFRTNLL